MIDKAKTLDECFKDFHRAILYSQVYVCVLYSTFFWSINQSK